MIPFPTEFAPHRISAYEYIDELDERGRRALLTLKSQGYQLSVGLCRDDIQGILPIAQSNEVVEYCPNDYSRSRFLQPASWLQKGRQAFVLRDQDEHIVGYSWTGPEACRYLEDYPITTAFRCAAHGMGAALVAATVSLSNNLHGPVGHGLETWASNARAVNTYLRCGAVVIRAMSDDVDASGNIQRTERPTIHSTQAHRQREDGAYMSYDTRLYMGFPWTRADYS